MTPAEQLGKREDGYPHPSSLFRLPLVHWLPDETVFSLCSRLHFLSGHHVPSKTSSLLFGSTRGGSAHDVPARLQSLVARLPGLGEARDVIAHHTLLPFYFPFHEAHRCQAWIEQMSLGAAPNLKAQLGVASSGFGAAHPLKACAECMDADFHRHGVAYWHLSHQLPGVLVCPMHKKALQNARDKVSGKDRFGWILPAEAVFIPPPHIGICGTAAFDLSKASMALHSLPTEFFFRHDRLTALYMGRMVEMGWTRRNDLTVARSAFEPALRRLLHDSPMSAAWPWMINGRDAHTLAERLIRISQFPRSRESRQPLNHLILQLLLYGTWDTFISEYLHASSPLSHCQEAPSSAAAQPSELNVYQQKEDHRSLLLERLHQGASATQVANELGIAVATAMTWASEAGITPARRPKLLKDHILRPLINALCKGEDKQRVAKRYGLSVQTITRVLLTEPGLKQKWSIAQFQIEKNRSRSAWNTIMNAMPGASSNVWRKLEPAAYAWMYRNDRAWLKNAIANRPQPTSISPIRRDRTARDQLHSESVQKARFDWFSIHISRHPTLADLCIQVQGLRQVLSVLHKLPLTQLAIREVCMTRRRADAYKGQSTIEGIADRT